MGNKVLRPNLDSPLDGFDEQQLHYLAEKFQILKDDKGYLNTDLLCQAYKCSPVEAEKFLKFVDNQENGNIDFYQFKCAAASLHQDDQEAQRMIYQIYSTDGQIKQQHFLMLYKTVFLYLKDMNIIQSQYKDEIGNQKFKKYDYNSNGSLDEQQFSDMLKNDYHCKKWMIVLGFREDDLVPEERIEKPENNLDQEQDDFAENQNTGDQATSTPGWIKTKDQMAPDTKPPKTHNHTPSNNLEIQYVYGYRSYDTRDNLKYTPSGEAVYHTAGVGIVLNQNKNTIKTMNLHNDDITCLDSKDNVTVTGQMGRRPMITVWDNDTMNSITTFSAPLEHNIACVAISPSKRYIAASSMSDKHEIAIYDIQNKKLIATGNGPRSVIYCLKFNQSEDTVAASCAKQVIFVEFKNGKFKGTKGIFGKTPVVAAFSLARYGNGFVSGMQNGTILVWKGTSCTKPYKQHTSAVSALTQTSKGGVISGDVGGNIVIWTSNLTIERKIVLSKLIKTPSNNPKVIALASNDSKILIGTRGGQIIQSDLSKNPASGNIIMQGHYDKQLWGVSSATKSNQFYTGGQDKLLLKWDINKRKLTAKSKLLYQIMSLDFNHKSNTLAVGMRNGIVQFYSTNKLQKVGKEITNYKNPDKQVISIVKYSPDCSILAIGYCPPISKVLFYDTNTFKKVGQCKNCVSRITSIDFTMDGDSIMLNNTSYQILFFKTDGSQVFAKSFKYGSWEKDNFATLSCKYSWQAQGIWPHLYADGTNINAIERSHGGKLLATGDDFSKIKLFNYPACFQKQIFNVYKGHSSHITGVKWSYQDDYLISIGGLQKSIIQWKMDKQEDLIYEAEKEEYVEPCQEEIQEEQEYQFEGEPQVELGKKKQKGNEDEDDDFAENQNQGDQAMAVKPFLGQVQASTPSKYLNPVINSFNVDPQETLKINYAWGIRNQYISDEVRNQLKYTQSGDSCVYFTAALGVQLNIKDQSQTFYNDQYQDLISMSITPDRKIVATGQMAQVDQSNKKIPKVSIHVWSIDNKTQVKELKNFHQRAIVILEFSPDGSHLLSIGQDDQNTLAVYNCQSWKIVWSAPTSKGKATGACWKNNVEYCTVGTDHIKFWTEAKGTMGKVPGKWESMYSVAFLDGAKYLSGGSSGALFLWNGGSASKIQAHKGKVHTIKVVKGKSVYTGGEDGKIICWKFNGNQISKQSEVADFNKISPLAPGILSIDFHPSKDRMLVCTKSSQIYQFPTSKFQQNKCLMKAHFAGQLWCCSISPDSSRFVTGGDDKTIRVYDINSHNQLKIAKTKNLIRAVDWSKKRPDLIVAGDWKGLIYLYDGTNTKSGELQELDIGQTKFSKMKPQKSTYWIEDIKFSPDGNYVAFGAHGGRSHIQLFKIDGNKFGSKSVLNVGFSSALLSLDWNLTSSVIVAVSQAYQFKFANTSAKGNNADIKASSMKDEQWASWSNKFGWMVQGIFRQVQYSSINSVCRDNSQSLIATGGDDQIVRLHKYPVIAPKQKGRQYFGHSSHVTRVKFSQDENYLLSTGGNDRTTILWDVIKPTKPKKLAVKQQEEQEEEIIQNVEDEDQQVIQGEQNQDNQGEVVEEFDNDIDVPKKAFQKQQTKANQIQEEDDDFAENQNKGDQFMASLPWKGAIKQPTIDYKQPSGKPPKVKISIDYAYGYRTKDCRNNLKFITKDTISYHTAGLGIVMDISTQPQQQTYFDKHTDDILSICWSPDKSSIFTGEQGPKCMIHEWDPEGNLIKTFKQMIKGVVALACNDKYLAAAGMDDNHIIIVYDKKSGKKYAKQDGGKQFIVALEFVDENTFVSVGIKHYKLWKIENGKITASKGSFKSNNNLLTSAKARGNKILVGAADGSLQIWQGTSIVKTIKNLHETKPLEAICCLQNVILTGGKDKKVNILNNEFAVIKTLDCSQLLKQSICPQIRAIDVYDNKLLLGTVSSQIYQISCSEKIDKVIKASQFKLVKCRMAGHYAANTKWTNQVWGLSVMRSDDKFVTCSDDSTVRVWDMKSKQQVSYQRLDLDKDGKPIPRNKLTGDFEDKAKGRCLAVSDNDYTLVGCKDGTLRVFDSKLKQISIKKITNKQISDIKFSADNSCVAIGAHDSKIYIYQWASKGQLKLLKKMTGHTSTITHIDFSQDGNYLHSNSRDYELLFWNTNTGEQITSGATQLRDQFFHTWTSCIGWPVEGIWQKFTKGTDINAIDRTKQPNPYEGKTLLCVGDDFGQVRLLQYPVRKKNSESINGYGHSSHVTCVRFINDDSMLISTGGEDQTVIQWKIQR